jgi:hypothetical protein
MRPITLSTATTKRAINVGMRVSLTPGVLTTGAGSLTLLGDFAGVGSVTGKFKGAGAGVSAVATTASWTSSKFPTVIRFF